MTVETLISDSDRYRLILALEHKEIYAFVQQYYQAKTSSLLAFKRFLSLCMLLFLGSVVYYLAQDIHLWDNILLNVGLGVFLFFLLIPLHELIHALLYKYMGATRVSFGVYWRKLAFFAIAPDFVVNRRQFFPIAIAPFLVINTLLIGWMLMEWQNPDLLMLGWGALLMHSMSCVGDFALIGFFEQHKGQKIYTFDRKGAGYSYFYVEN